MGRGYQSRGYIWAMSLILMIGWLTPLALVAFYDEMGMPYSSYTPVLYFAGPLALLLVYAGTRLRSRALWCINGALPGVVMLGQWMPLTPRGLFCVRAKQIKPGMTLAEVEGRMFGSQEAHSPASQDYNEEITFGWDLDGNADSDALTVNIKDGRVRHVFLGSEE